MSPVPINLPVYNERDRILAAISQNQVVILESPTGSGKTTQLPIILHEAGYTKHGTIGITQPRRVAAVGVCRYIAHQIGSQIGEYVGYKMRFEDRTGPDTRLKVLTDGTLLQEMKSDRWLSRYCALVIDEAHERTLNIDFILGLLKDILPHRPDLKVIISSATLNPEAISTFFDNCPVISIETPMFPVKIHYESLPVESNEEILIRSIVRTVEQILQVQSDCGGILIFCTGERMIKDTINELKRSAAGKRIYPLPLYGRLGSEEQERIFDPVPDGFIKVVAATNVAETSVTIDNISAVVDTGIAKMNFYKTKTYTSTLAETPISRASADQRKGRAGRTRPGVCYRLYTEQDYESRPPFTKEEVYRTDLSEVVLRMAQLGIQNFETFPFISPPRYRGIQNAVDALRLLDAIDEENLLTDIGKQMVPYPLLPRHARMIVESILRYPDVIRETIIVTAFLSTNPPFLLPQGEEQNARRAHHTFRSAQHGDFASYINLYWEYVDAADKSKFSERYYLDRKIMDEILSITQQLEDITSVMNVPIGSGGCTENLLKACARGLIPFICIRDGKFSYRSFSMEKIIIHPGSVLFRESPEIIAAGEIVLTSRAYARSVSPLKREWLKSIHPLLPQQLLPSSPGRKDRKNNSSRKDSSGEFWIGGESFPVTRTPGKGNRKRVLFDWPKLHALLKKSGGSFQDFNALRGSLFIERKEMLADVNVNIIMKIARLINPGKNILDDIPKGNFSFSHSPHRETLLKELPAIPSVVLRKKKRKKGAVDFLALCSNGKDNFWFRGIRGFHEAVITSLESVEILLEELKKEQAGDDVLRDVKAILVRLEDCL